jgi:hypothetical protein
MPFYKRENDTLLTASAVYSPSYELTEENKPTEPVDGWMWYATLEDAATAIMSFQVDGVPQAITKRQGRRQLVSEGLLSSVEGYMNSLPVDDITRMAYEDSSQWLRHNPDLIKMLNLLGKTDEETDQFFIKAANL